MHQKLWRYKVEEKIYLGVRERKRLNVTAPWYEIKSVSANHTPESPPASTECSDTSNPSHPHPPIIRFQGC
jgi:hypothetical protein